MEQHSGHRFDRLSLAAILTKSTRPWDRGAGFVLPGEECCEVQAAGRLHRIRAQSSVSSLDLVFLPCRCAEIFQGIGRDAPVERPPAGPNHPRAPSQETA